MLKFFRKIRQQLISDNLPDQQAGSFSKYLLYAAGEILLVMIGILLALQINNWNEHRKDRVEEQIILKDLKTDFQADLLQLWEKIIGIKNSEANIISIATTLINKEKASFENFNMDSLQKALLIRPSFDPKVGNLNELNGSGKLRIIQNRVLRKHLSSWSSHLQEAKEIEERLHETRARTHDYLMEHFPMADLFNASGGWRRIKFKSNFSMDKSLILKDPKFENLLSLKSSWHQYLLRRYAVIEQEIQEILSLIEKEIKNI